MACKATFTMIRRRHHCRNCGGLFCGACSSKRIALLDAYPPPSPCCPPDPHAAAANRWGSWWCEQRLLQPCAGVRPMPFLPHRVTTLHSPRERERRARTTRTRSGVPSANAMKSGPQNRQRAFIAHTQKAPFRPCEGVSSCRDARVDRSPDSAHRQEEGVQPHPEN
jgi:hypothetical protein